MPLRFCSAGGMRFGSGWPPVAARRRTATMAVRARALPSAFFASVEVPTGGDYLVSAAGCSVLLGCVGFERQARPAGVGQMARA